MFTDEVWAMGGAHTTSYVTIKKDGLDRHIPENLQHKYSKVPAWMYSSFHGSKSRAYFYAGQCSIPQISNYSKKPPNSINIIYKMAPILTRS
jgi:hypothetical protein